MGSKTKVCPACQRDLPLSAYYNSRGRCIECRKEYQLQYHGSMRVFADRIEKLEQMVSELAAKVA